MAEKMYDFYEEMEDFDEEMEDFDEEMEDFDEVYLERKIYDPRIKKALEKINFIERYQALSLKYAWENVLDGDILYDVDRNRVLSMIQDMGYKAGYNRREKFFYTKDEKIGNLVFSNYIELKYGSAAFIWNIEEGDELLLADDCRRFSLDILEKGFGIKDAAFCDYEELEDILKTNFEMYEDLKKAMLEG